MKKALRSFAFTGMILIILSAFFTACEQPNSSSTEPTDAAAPTISAQPAGGAWNVGVADSFTATVTAAVTDGGTLSYQWYSNTSANATGGTVISGQTQETLTLAKTAYATNGARYFYVVVTNTLADNGDGGVKNASVTSAAITVTVSGNTVAGAVNAAEPTISAQPAGGAWDVASADTFPLRVTAASTDGGTVSYQWYSNTSAAATGGSAIDEETGETLTLAKADYTKNAPYYFYVVVTNTLTDNGDGGRKAASIPSDPITVTVSGHIFVNAAAPTISAQPAGGPWDVSGAETFTMNVTAANTDNGTLSYQWYSNTSASVEGGVALNGKTQNALTLAKAAYATNGSYYFYVVVTNTIDDNGDGGNKSATLASGAVTVTVSGNAINAAVPIITEQPSGGVWNVVSTETFPMTVTANSADEGDLSYQWYSNTTASVEDGTLLVGKTEATLTLEKAEYPPEVNYYFYAVVTNEIEDNGDGGRKVSSRTSDPVTVTVTEYEAAPQSVKDTLAGTWVEPYSTYTIDAATFNSGTDYGGYGGTIENVRVKQGSLDEGFITIKYTYNDNAVNAVGRYYVIHFQSLTDDTMAFSGAYNGDDPDFGANGYGGGKETLEAAEATFTIGSGSFAVHTDITKIGDVDFNTPVPEGLINTWEGEEDGMGYYIMDIADKVVILKYDMGLYGGVQNNFTATIVNVNPLTETSGYITLYYDLNQAGVNKNKYGVLYYQDLAGDTSVNMVVAANSPYGWGGSSKDTAEEAEAAYVWTPDAEVDGGGYLVNNNGNKNATLTVFTPAE